MRYVSFLALSIVLTSCSLVSPYQITFTTPEKTIVDPSTATLDFAVSAPALAYISEIDCDGADDIEILPIVTDEMQAKTAHNLALTSLNGAPGSECEITVTAFDQTTTATAQAEITLVIFGEPAAEDTAEDSPASDAADEPAADDEVAADEPTGEEPATEDVPTEDADASPEVETEVDPDTTPEETPVE